MRLIYLFSDYECCCSSGESKPLAAFTSKSKADKYQKENPYLVRAQVELDEEPDGGSE